MFKSLKALIKTHTHTDILNQTALMTVKMLRWSVCTSDTLNKSVMFYQEDVLVHISAAL